MKIKSIEGGTMVVGIVMMEITEVLAADGMKMIDQMVICTGRMREIIRKEAKTVINIGKMTDTTIGKVGASTMSHTRKEDIEMIEENDGKGTFKLLVV